MNNINEKQNEEDILMLLYSQRKHYDNAGKIQYFIWISMIINIIINNNKFICDYLGATIVKAISGVLMLLYIYLRFKIRKNIDIGASTKQLIDCKLFGLKYETYKKYTRDKIFEFAISNRNRNKKEYLIQINNTGKDKPRGVKNWYEDRTGLDLNRAIYECQKENLWWDEKLCKIYMIGFVAINVLSLIVIIAINRNETLTSILAAVIFPSLQIFVEVLTEFWSFIKILIYRGKIDERSTCIEKDLDNINLKDLERVQELIFERRLYKFLIPTNIHSIVSVKFHNWRESIFNLVMMDM